MTPLDARMLELWQQNRRDPLFVAFAYRREALDHLHTKWSAEARMGHPEYDEGDLRLVAERAERDRRHWLRLAINIVQDAKERRHAA